MARSRNIKPAFFKNEDLAEVDAAGRLLFIGLWTLADRNGLLEYRPKRIRAEIFPYEPETDVNGYITVLARLGFIHELSDGNNDYILIVNFTKHQNPHHTEKTALPDANQLKAKEIGVVTVKEPLSNGDNPADSLLLIPDSLIRKPETLNTETVKPEPVQRGAEQVADVFSHWQQVLDHPKAKLSEDRKKVIKKALASYEAAELKEAISGCSKTPHNMGDNDRGERYDSLKLIFRDSDQIDRFIRNNTHPPRPKGAHDRVESLNRNAVDEFLSSDSIDGEIVNE